MNNEQIARLRAMITAYADAVTDLATAQAFGSNNWARKAAQTAKECADSLDAFMDEVRQ